jgi:hypothetical protein
MSLGGIQDKRGFRNYLKDNGGVRVYRDAIRVYDYGEPGNDWLSLDLERVNLPTARISNNIVIGAISLDRLKAAILLKRLIVKDLLRMKHFTHFIVLSGL